jgi:hypothetical protein
MSSFNGIRKQAMRKGRQISRGREPAETDRLQNDVFTESYQLRQIFPIFLYGRRDGPVH